MSKKIAIIGAGTGGLHLGIYLQQHGVETTIYTDRPAEKYAGIRLPNTVIHFEVTIANEDKLGVNHWQTNEVGIYGQHYWVGTPEPISFYGDYHAPARSIDYRIYWPALMSDYVKRGGKLEIRTIEKDDYKEIAKEHDLIVVATGKGTGDMFPQRPEHTPHTKPVRQLCVGLWKGVEQLNPRALTYSIAPGVGEMVEIPTLTFNGMQMALYMPNIPGGDTEVLVHTNYDDDAGAFKKLMLDKLAKHYPRLRERINDAEFDLANSNLDLLQGGVTPTVRESSVRIDENTLAIALGDVLITVDPAMGQGANSVSNQAMILGEEIVKQDVLDERFVERVDARRFDRALSASRWTNFMLAAFETFPPEFVQFIVAISQDKKLADKFTDNFNYPDRSWDVFASPRRIARFAGLA